MDRLKFDFLKSLKLKKQVVKGFTMAEVLITIGVIGLVAAMTLPGLINKINLREYISLLKSDYSILSQAHLALVAEYGTFEASIIDCTDSKTKHNCLRDTFAKKIKSVRTCDEPYHKDDVKSSCFAEFDKIRLLNNSIATEDYLNWNGATMMLPNGSAVLFYLDDASCKYNFDGYFNYNRCGWITIDVNGNKNPNKFGIDIYVFYVMANAVKPLAYEYLHESLQNGDCTPESSGYSCSSIYILK